MNFRVFGTVDFRGIVLLVSMVLWAAGPARAETQSLKCKIPDDSFRFKAEIHFDEWELGKPCRFDFVGMKTPVQGLPGRWMSTMPVVDIEHLAMIGQIDQIPVDVAFIPWEKSSAFVVLIDPIQYFLRDFRRVKIQLSIYAEGRSMDIELGDFECTL